MSTGFIDFSATTISEGGGTLLPNGVFPGVVQSSQNVTSTKGSPQSEFKVEISEPAYAGAVRTEWINLSPSNPNDAGKVKAHTQVWGAAFLSVGFTPDALKAAGRIPHEQIPGLFAGRGCFVEISTRMKADGTPIQAMKFLKPATYETRRKAQDEAGGPEAMAAAAAMMAPAVAPAAAVGLPTPLAAAPVAVAAAPALAQPAGLAALGVAAPVVAAPVLAAPVVAAPVVAAAAAPSAGLAALLGR